MRRRSSPLLLALALAGCSRGATEAPPPAPRPVTVGAEGVTVAEVDRIATGPVLSGSLEPAEEAAVRAEVGGQVLSVDAELGERVREGDVLARIEARALEQAFASARSAVTSARAELSVVAREAERTERLVQVGALAERDLEQARAAATAARARLREAEARLASAGEQLDAATVEAPMDGVVASRAVSTGDVIAPGAMLFRIIDPSSMRLEASVPSGQLSALEVGTPVRFEVRGYPHQTFTGQIERIAPAADPATRQIPLLVQIPNPGGRLVAGLFAEGTVAAETREGLVVPFAAVDEEGPAPTVLAVRGGEAVEVPVRLGIRDEGREEVEIVAGLEAGEVVLTGPARTVAPGTPVKLPPAIQARGGAVEPGREARTADEPPDDAGPAPAAPTPPAEP